MPFVSLTGLSPSPAALSSTFCYSRLFFLHGSSPCGPTTPPVRFGLLRFRSPLLTESLLISFPGLLRWFTSSGMTPSSYFIQMQGAGISPCGLPHSAIPASKDMCSSTGLFAACHGLLRLSAPRHPPWTYIRLTILFFLLLPHSSAMRVHFQSSRTPSLACSRLLFSFLPSLFFSKSFIYGTE